MNDKEKKITKYVLIALSVPFVAVTFVVLYFDALFAFARYIHGII